MKYKIALLTFSLLLAVSSVKAALIITGSADLADVPNSINGNMASFLVSSVDLVNAGQSTLLLASTSGTTAFGSAFSAVNDGTAGDGINYNIADGYAATASGYTITFDLDTSVNILGYDISSIATFAGWQSYRANQSYEIFYRTVGNGYQSLTSVNYLPAVSSGFNNGTRVALTDDSGFIITGVDSIQFSINRPAGVTETIFREFDISGIATIPEPTTYMLVLLAWLAFLALRSCRAKA
jgi:hypothetical protein